tara:strand:+ start:55 stop:303 length:249 start_codon:yes stop_codon:yes gene_type:complete
VDVSHHHFWRYWRNACLERLTMIDKLKDYFRLPSAKELAVKELEMAHRKLLVALSAQEYAKRMGDYHSDRIKRLTAYLKDEA